jgi:hypothetical protein
MMQSWRGKDVCKWMNDADAWMKFLFKKKGG